LYCENYSVEVSDVNSAELTPRADYPDQTESVESEAYRGEWSYHLECYYADILQETYTKTLKQSGNNQPIVWQYTGIPEEHYEEPDNSSYVLSTNMQQIDKVATQLNVAPHVIQMRVIKQYDFTDVESQHAGNDYFDNRVTGGDGIALFNFASVASNNVGGQWYPIVSTCNSELAEKYRVAAASSRLSDIDNVHRFGQTANINLADAIKLLYESYVDIVTDAGYAAYIQPFPGMTVGNRHNKT